MSNHSRDICQWSNIGPYSAFSTSPSQLQEVTLDPETSGIISTSQTAFATSVGDSVASGSMKQYEEQVGVLRKENFHLKLRVYFLEERLGNTTPLPMQDVLEDNVKLQVELEELRRQLSEKQDLLTAAVKAMDVLEQKANKNMPPEKDMGESDDSLTLRLRVQQLEERIPDQESINLKESIGKISNELTAPLEFTEDEKEELSKLKRDHLTACQMIRGCMMRIKKLEKDIKEKELKLEELTEKSNEVGIIQLNEILEKLKIKDHEINELTTKLTILKTKGDLPTMIENQDQKIIGNRGLQEVLTRRLQGLVYFLDSLLLHKCVIGQEKREMAKNLLEQSLAFLDETVAGDLTVDESNFDMSNLLKLEDLSLLLGHHHTGEQLENKSNNHHNLTWPENGHSESDCWSEPDRSVSLARMGLSTTLNNFNEITSDESRCRNRRNRANNSSRADPIEADEKDFLLSENSRLLKEKDQLQEKLNRQSDIQVELTREVELLQEQLKNSCIEKDSLTEKLVNLQQKVSKIENDLRDKEEKLHISESHSAEAEILLNKDKAQLAKLKMEMQENETRLKGHIQLAEERCMELKEIERNLHRQVDEATLQASQAALDRTRYTHERLQAERNLEQLRVNLEESEKNRRQAELKAASLEVKLSELAGEQELLQQQLQLIQVAKSDDDRATSPDLGIDSDRLSSLENLNSNCYSLTKRQLVHENKELREKLDRSKAALEEAVAHLNKTNSRKHQVQRAICRQIHKTHDVLRQARTNLQQPNRPPQADT